MSKIMVADDSPTIQKVVAITLTGHDFELDQSISADDLLKKLKIKNYELILLDMGLAEGKNVASYLQEIRSLSTAPILGMYGTFDTVNEAQTQKIGLADFIVKPFESDKFIEKCKTLVSSGSNIRENLSLMQDEQNQEENANENADENSFEIIQGAGSNNDEQMQEWSMQENIAQSHEINLELSAPVEKSPDITELSQNLKDWGFSVPGVIGTKQSIPEKPPIIAEEIQAIDEEEISHEKTGPISLSKIMGSSAISSTPSTEDDNSILPKDDDLAYPDFGASPKSKLVPIDELTIAPDEEDEDATDPGFSIADAQKRGANLEMALEGEITAEDFWAIDDSSKKQAKANKAEVHKSADLENLKKVTKKDREFEIELGPVGKKKNNQQSPHASNEAEQSIPSDDELIDKLLNRILPLIEARVDERIRLIAEKVSWEVIPDLAENMIKNELKDVVKTVYQELKDVH